MCSTMWGRRLGLLVVATAFMVLAAGCSSSSDNGCSASTDAFKSHEQAALAAHNQQQQDQATMDSEASEPSAAQSSQMSKYLACLQEQQGNTASCSTLEPSGTSHSRD